MKHARKPHKKPRAQHKLHVAEGEKIHIKSKGAVGYVHKSHAPKTKIVVKKVEVIKRVPVFVNSHTKVMTSNPTIVDHKLITPQHLFVSAEGSNYHSNHRKTKTKSLLVVVKELRSKPVEASKNMKVITDYPVIIDNKRKSPKEYYLNAGGSENIFQKTEDVLNKTQGALNKGSAAVQGASQTANSLNNAAVSVSNAPSPSTTGGTIPSNTTSQTPKKGMGVGAKVGIVFGIVAVAVGIFLVVKKGKKSK